MELIAPAGKLRHTWRAQTYTESSVNFKVGRAYRRSLAVVRALHLTELQQRLSRPIVQTKQAISQMRAKKYAALSSSQYEILNKYDIFKKETN